ncbi:hypothetical protein Ahy_A10g050279 isoform C [Arachis hypogaea]|uniref:Uncharacterized protein n=1 Tax=Arachis hypogaea TaxID=3818 RepID=A0A445B8Z6_ARAHY|nr:hypothetical protein Ahy_A10g050279 isoform C [Arachis hypogaea]
MSPHAGIVLLKCCFNLICIAPKLTCGQWVL